MNGHIACAARSGALRFLDSTVLALALSAAPAVHAAEGEAGPPIDQLETIVVTAEHRSIDAQDLPIALTAISGDQISRSSKVSLDTVLKDVPALQIQASPQGGQIFIRGVGANGDSDWVDPDVALMFDGVYSGRAETVLSSLYDVNRIEVLRGPQGTLYGRNANGGVINIMTNSPVLGSYQAGVNLGGGNYNLFHADGYTNLPLGDEFALRFAGARDTHYGYYSNGGGAADDDSWRAKALWQPEQSLSLLLSVNYWRYGGFGQTTVPTSATPWPSYEANSPWNVGPLVLGPNVFNLLPDHDNSHFATYSLQLNADLGWGQLTVIPAYSYSDRWVLTQLFAPGPQVATIWKEDQFTGEVRLQSPDESNIKWVTGFYALHSKQTTSGAGAGSVTFLAFPTTDHPSTSLAPFLQVTYPILEHLRLTGGLRYTMDKKSVQYGVCTSFVANDGVTCDSSVPVADPAASEYNSGISTYSNRYSALTYKAGVEYDVAADSMLYAQVATGYKAGGYSTTAFPPVAYRPEKLTAFELGSKNRFLENRLELNAEIYSYDYRNYQVQYALYVPFTTTIPAAYLANVPAATLATGEFQQFVANAGSGRNYGGEIESKFRVTTSDQLNASVSYTRATYGTLVIPNAGGPPGTTTASGVSVLTGAQMANTPKWIGTLSYEHNWNIARGVLTLRAATKLSSGYFATVDEWYGGAYQPSYHSSDLYLNYGTDNGHWGLGLWVKNLENDAQKTYVFPFFRAELASPRTYGGTVSYRFD